ncbi:MAG: hypothetical protein IPI21_16720 [Propionivibrio sp.]|nr:hypothetical protein [Propionivibrio sp.]
MSVDAEMTAWLLGSPLEDPDAETASATKNSPALILQKRYEQAVQALPGSAREWDSVVKQWRLLAGFIRLSARKESAKYADNLIALADHFAPETTAGNTRTATSTEENESVRTKAVRAKNPRKRADRR